MIQSYTEDTGAGYTIFLSRVIILYKFAKTQPEDEWKIPVVKELTDINQGVLFFPIMTTMGSFYAVDLTEILEYVTTI